MNDQFDDWLESELAAGLAARVSSALPEPTYLSARRSTLHRLPLLSGLPFAISAKLVAGVAAVAFAAGTTAAVVATDSGGGGGGSLIAQSVASDRTTHTDSSDSTRTDASADAASKTTRSSSTNHGDAVTSAVASCKASESTSTSTPTPGPGARGIGQCVAAVASDGKAHPSPDSNPLGERSTPGADHPAPPPHPTPPLHPGPATHS